MRNKFIRETSLFHFLCGYILTLVASFGMPLIIIIIFLYTLSRYILSHKQSTHKHFLDLHRFELKIPAKVHSFICIIIDLKSARGINNSFYASCFSFPLKYKAPLYKYADADNKVHKYTQLYKRVGRFCVYARSSSGVFVIVTR